MKSKMKNKLGLPLEYSKLHQFYDLLCLQGLSAKNKTIEKLLRKQKVKTVLDLTCGTGAQVFWFAKRGYKVTGSDVSSALLAIAKEKAKKAKSNIRLIKGDMRNIQAGSFDAAITISNAIGHLTKTDFIKAIRNINRNLKTGGVYVFDIFNLQAMTDQAVNHLAMDLKKSVNNIKVRNIQYSKLNKNNGRLTSYDYFSIQSSTAKPKILKGKFTLQLYTAKEIKQMLEKNGFNLIEQYDLDGSPFLPKKSIHILTVAQKC